MKLELKKRKANPLLEREECEGLVDHEGGATPSSESLKGFLSEELDISKEKLEVDKIFTLKGRQKSKFWTRKAGISEEAGEIGKEEEGFECDECGKSFDSKRGLSIHQAQAHKVDRGEILSGTISEAKDEIEEMENPDYEKFLEAEKEGKDRKGMKKFLSEKIEEEDE